MAFPVDHPVWPLLAQGYEVVTVNRRLSRALLDSYAGKQRRDGVTVWQTPPIRPLDDWLQQAVSRYGRGKMLLDSTQSMAVWEQVVEDDLQQSDYDLLQVQATVRQVERAHGLCCAYLVDDYTALGPEQEAFVRWRRSFLRRCQQQNWLDSRQLPGYVQQLVAQGHCLLPGGMAWLGFDELTPQLLQLKTGLDEAGCPVHLLAPHAVEDVVLDAYYADDESHELRSAAQWARRQLEEQVGVVAVVIPELQRLQPLAQRIFARELARSEFPERVPVDSFNISLGTPLADQGMVTAALTLLQLEDEVEFDTLSYLLRCPWFAGGVKEADHRALLECQLRRNNVLRISLGQLIEMLRRQPNVSELLLGIFAQVHDFVRLHEHSGAGPWVERVAMLLERVGWPGEQPLDSASYQVFAAWNDKILGGLSRLGLVRDTFSRQQAVATLARLARELLFQPKAQDNRLQIVGLLETAGLSFDALWLSGATEKVFPGQVSFNPFLPVAVQKQMHMPHSSCVHETNYARLMLDRLCQSAPQVVVSYATMVDERDCQGSPFLLQRFNFQPIPVVVDGDHDSVPVPLEFLEDSRATPLSAAQRALPITGGTGLLKEQVQCPFKAYLHYRLKIRALEVPQPGLTSRRRGDLLHRVLQGFWQQTMDQQGLLGLDDDALAQRVASHVDRVIAATRFSPHERGVLAVERQRLCQLVCEWLQVEQQRPMFRVDLVEQRQQLEVGPLRLTTIPDRIDMLHDGRQLVIDYKTGKVTAADLVGEVLFEPQLPVYAVMGMDGQVAAVTFAQVSHGECCFKGVAEEDQLVDGVRSVAKSRGVHPQVDSWHGLLECWRQQLEQSAHRYADGDAAVLPVHQKVCLYCDLKGLCRIDLQGQITVEEE